MNTDNFGADIHVTHASFFDKALGTQGSLLSLLGSIYSPEVGSIAFARNDTGKRR